MRNVFLTVALAVLFLSLQLTQIRTAAAQANKASAVKITDGPRVEGVGDSWAVVAWTTNTGGSSVVRYGTDRNRLDQTAQAPYANKSKGAENHRVRIQHLKPNTTYYFQADSGQGEGTGTEAKSPVEQFTTKASGQHAAKPGESGERREAAVKIIDGPKVEAVDNASAVIAWTTNSASSSIVHYGTDRNHLSQVAKSAYVDVENASYQTHRVRLTGLKPNTTYYFTAYSGQGEDTGTEATSPVAEFKTK